MSRPDTKIVTVQKDPNFIEMASADAKYPEGIGRLTRTPSSPLIPLDEVVRVVENISGNALALAKESKRYSMTKPRCAICTNYSPR